MAKTITLIRGDSAEAIEETLSNADGAQDVTGATVTAHLRETTSGALIPDVACALVDAALGLVAIPAAARAAWAAGEYSVRWKVVYADGSIDWFPTNSTNTIRILEAWS